MLLLISDANILIDMEAGGLLLPIFSLDCTFAVPDILYHEELEAMHSDLPHLGLVIHTMDAEDISKVLSLGKAYRAPSRNDLFALILARKHGCPLLTGDRALRKAAETESVEVKGSVWLLMEMVHQQRITAQVARAALQKMRDKGRRLHWAESERQLAAYESQS